MRLLQHSVKLRRPPLRRVGRRRGLAQMEAVMTTAVVLPLAVALFFMGLKACQYFYQIMSALVSWPYL